MITIKILVISIGNSYNGVITHMSQKLSKCKREMDQIERGRRENRKFPSN